MIEVSGKFTDRMATKGEFSKKHFHANGDFLNKDPDSITGVPDVWPASKHGGPQRPISDLLQQALKTPGSGIDQATHNRWVTQLAELTSQCLQPDPELRTVP